MPQSTLFASFTSPLAPSTACTWVCTSCPPQSALLTLVPMPLAPSMPPPFAPAVVSSAVAVVVHCSLFIIITSSLCLMSPSLVCPSGGIPRHTCTLHLHPPANFKSVTAPAPAPTPNALDACKFKCKFECYPWVWTYLLASNTGKLSAFGIHCGGDWGPPTCPSCPT